MNQRNLVPIFIIAVNLFAELGLTAFAIDNPQGQAAASEALDAALSDRVETLLRTDIGFAGARFRIHTDGGVVTVGGSVPDEHSLRRALDLASGVKGVREIRNGMVIDFPK